MTEINSQQIQKAIEELCIKANTCINRNTYNAYLKAYKNETNSQAKSAFSQILHNVELAKQKQRPLCQDTGIVVVFAEIGQEVSLKGDLLEDAINKGIAECYNKNLFRKSVVKNPVSERKNTDNNTPAIIHTEIVKGNKINLSLMIKGGGSENMSSLKMLKPCEGKEGIINLVLDTVKSSGANSCPPVRVGIGVGGSMEKAAILSKKALLNENKEEKDNEILDLEKEILKKVNQLNIGPMGLGGQVTATDVSILTSPCHIASLPVAVNINCHSSRHAKCTISENKIKYDFEEFKYKIEQIEEKLSNIPHINLQDINSIRKLKAGDEVLLSGIVYTARDAAHKKLVEIIDNKQELPFQIENSAIFYVGPCPAKNNEIVGPIGPTTSCRMDKYTPKLLDGGLIATIGKGDRTKDVVDAIKKNKSVYFTTTGGVAVLLSEKVKKAELIAFPELGPEAIYKFEIKDFPAIVNIDSEGNTITT